MYRIPNIQTGNPISSRRALKQHGNQIAEPKFKINFKQKAESKHELSKALQATQGQTRRPRAPLSQTRVAALRRGPPPAPESARADAAGRSAREPAQRAHRRARILRMRT
eukprot:6172985-Pleurochrysis_carterae.AAC.3